MLLYSLLHLTGVKAVNAQYETRGEPAVTLDDIRRFRQLDVVSMPSWELFDRQPQTYRDEVLPAQVTARVSVEQASTFGWERFVGLDGQSIGMHTFGASAPLAALERRFGFTPDHVGATARALVRPAGRPDVETRSSR
jgi:transketolase